MSFKSSSSIEYSTKCTFNSYRLSSHPKTIGRSIWMTWYNRLNNSRLWRNQRRKEAVNQSRILRESLLFMRSRCYGTKRESPRSPRWGKALRLRSLRIALSSQKKGLERYSVLEVERLRTPSSRLKTQPIRQSKLSPSHFQRFKARAIFRTKLTQTTSKLILDPLVSTSKSPFQRWTANKTSSQIFRLRDMLAGWSKPGWMPSAHRLFKTSSQDQVRSGRTSSPSL